MKKILLFLFALLFATLSSWAQWIPGDVCTYSTAYSVQNTEGFPRNNRGIAVSNDGEYLYLGYNTPIDFRRILLSSEAQFGGNTTDRAKCIAVDDLGRVYQTGIDGEAIKIYDSNLSNVLYTIPMTKTEGIAVKRIAGSLYLYATERNAGTLSRYLLTESGSNITMATLDGLDGDGVIPITGGSGIRGVAVGPDDKILVANAGAGKIYKLNADGSGQVDYHYAANDNPYYFAFIGSQVFVTHGIYLGVTRVAVIKYSDMTLVGNIVPSFVDLGYKTDDAEDMLSGIAAFPDNKGFYLTYEGGSTTDNLKKEPVIKVSFPVKPVNVYSASPTSPANWVSSHSTIQGAINATTTLAGYVIEVAAGTYTGNINVNKNISLIGAGSSLTIIDGLDAGGTSGAVYLASGRNGVTIQGFHIKGIDGPMAVEYAAVYLSGTQNNISILDNIIEARGDAALMGDYNAQNDNIIISGNTFTGQTFTGTQPATGNQYTIANVARQAILFGGSTGTTNTKNFTFTNNTIATISGVSYRGNTLVTLDLVGVNTISGNFFTGTAYTQALRLRGSGNYNVNNNDFSGTYSKAIERSGTAIDAPCNWWGTANIASIPSKITGSVSYLPFKTSASGQCDGIGPVQNITQGTSYLTIAAAVAAANPAPIAKDVILVSAGTYTERVTIDKNVDLRGPNYDINPNTTARVAEAFLSNSQATYRSFTISAGNLDISLNGFRFDRGLPISDNNVTGSPKNSTDVTFSYNLVERSNGISAGINTSWKNLVIGNNKFLNINGTATNSAMQLTNLLSAIVTNNTFSGVNSAANLEGIPTSIVSGNIISTTKAQAAINLAGAIGDATVQDNAITNTSTSLLADNNAICLDGSGFTGVVLITNNTISGGYYGITVKNGVNITGKDITVTKNSITSGLAGGKAIYHGGTGTLDATCNWFGTDLYENIYTKVTGLVVYVPYLLTSNLSGTCGGGPAIPASLTVTHDATSQNIQVAFDVTANELELKPIPGLNPTAPDDLLAIQVLYQALAIAMTGTDEDAIQAAALAVGDDIITEYYYMNGTTKVYLETAGGNLLIKNKYWDNYLVRNDNVTFPDWTVPRTLITQDLYRTNTNPATLAVADGWLNPVLGKDLHVKVTFVNNGNVNSLEKIVAITAGPVNVYSASPAAPGNWVSSHTKIQDAIDASTTLANYIIVADAGTYNESDIIINKAGLVIEGAGKANTFIYPDPLKIDIKGCSAVSTGTPHNGIIVAADNVTIKNLTIDGGTNQDYRNGIISKFWTQASPYIANTVNYAATIIKDVKVTNTNSFGIYIRSNTSKTSGHKILNTVVINGSSYDVCQQNAWAIYGFNTDIEITGCYVENWIHGIGTGSNGSTPICNITGNTVKDVKLQAYTLTLNGAGSFFNGNTALFTDITASNWGTGLVTYELEGVQITQNTFTNGANGISVGSQNKTKDKLIIGPGNIISGFKLNKPSIDEQTCGVIAVDNSWQNAARNFTFTGNTISGYDIGILIYPYGLSSTMKCDADINYNSISGNTTNLYNIGTSPNVTLDATCNWWGSNDVYAVQAAVIGEAQVLPYSTVANPMNCNGYGPVVVYEGPAYTDVRSSHMKIQEAVDAVVAGDMIKVDAGTYAENLTIGKSLTILGPNAANDGCGTRVAEAIIVPATNSPADWSSQLVLLTANNITIKGFTIDGDNPLLGGTGDYNVSQGIVGVTGQANILIENNIIKNLATAGINLSDDANASSTSGNIITYNKIDNINPTAGFGIGVYTGNNTYVDITNNCMTNVRKGIQGGENNHKANTGDVSPVWSGNTIQSYKIGIWNNLAYSDATPVTISGNTVTTVTGSTINSGIEISSIQGTRSVNVFGNTVTGAMAGINLWNNTTTAPLVIGANTFTDCGYGVFANNYDGYNSNADPSSYIINGGTITNPLLAGVYVKDNPLNSNGATVAVNVAGTSISGTAAGMAAFLVEGASASLSFSGVSPQATISGAPKYIVLQSNGTDVPAGNIDATAVSFDGKLGSAMSLAELFATEDKIDHKIDLLTLGFVTVKANNDYVTVNSFVAPNTAADINRGITAAGATGWTVNVAAGTYNNLVNANKSITLLGANADISCPNRLDESLVQDLSQADVAIFTVNSDGVTINGFEIVAPWANQGIYNGSSGKSNLNIKFNYIHNIGTSRGSGNVYAIHYLVGDAVTTSDVNITDNCIDNVLNTTLTTTKSSAGIWVGQSTTTGILNNLTIDRNSITNIKSGVSGQVAQGMAIITASGNTTGRINNLKIRNNTITGIFTKATAAAISLDGKIDGTEISNNLINNATGSGTLYGVNLPSTNTLAATAVIKNNSFTNVSRAINTGNTNAIVATCNWYGSTVPATVKGKITGTAVIYQPWLTSGADDAGVIGFQPQVACDFDVPVGGLLTMTTNLYPSGLTAMPLSGVYTIATPLSFNGIDVLQGISLVVTDANLNTANVPVFINTVENGYMQYDAPNSIWNYAGQTVAPAFTDGVQSVTATFADLAGNTTPFTLNFTTDATAPVITLLGNATVSLCKGDPYTDEGATAFDAHDGNITSKIEVTGLPINVNTPGTYIITYHVSDEAGNPAVEGTRTVTINPLPTPSITGNTTVVEGSTEVYSTTNVSGHTYAWVVTGGTALVAPATPNFCEVTWGTGSSGTVIVTETIAATGCNSVTQIDVAVNAIALQGTITYKNNSSTPMNNVTVTLLDASDAVKATTTSDISGKYSFATVPEGVVKIQVETAKDWGGGNSTDALAIQRTAIGFSFGWWNPVNFLNNVADVTNSGSVLSSDALWVKKRTVYLVNNFPAGDWAFWRVNYAIPEDGTNFENSGSHKASMPLNFTGDAKILDIKAMCYGDVNGSYQPSSTKSVFAINSNSVTNVNKNLFKIPVQLQLVNDQSIGAATIHLWYDTRMVEIKELVTTIPNLIYTIKEGWIHIAWSDLQPLSIPADGTIFTLIGRAHQELNSYDEVFMLSNETQFADMHCNVLTDVYLNINRMNTLKTGIEDSQSDYSINCFPNPVQTTLSITYSLSERGQVEITIINSLGETIARIADNAQDAGSYLLKFDPVKYGLNNGVYYCRMLVNGESSDFSKVVRIVYMK